MRPPGRRTQGYNGYPYDGARLDVWGYDLLSRSLRDPDDHRDAMSYCLPMWISDHHFARFFERIQIVNQRAFAPGPSKTYRAALVGSAGVWTRRSLCAEPHQLKDCPD